MAELEPDIYVKGQDAAQQDPPIRRDNAIMFASRPMVYSSGDILLFLTALMDDFRNRIRSRTKSLQRPLYPQYDVTGLSIANLLHRFRGLPVMVIGDYILDRYHFCDATGIAGEAHRDGTAQLESRECVAAQVIALHRGAGRRSDPRHFINNDETSSRSSGCDPAA